MAKKQLKSYYTGCDEFQNALTGLMTEANSLAEQLRISVIKKFNIMNTTPEEIYNDIVDLAAELYGTRSAVITFIDKELALIKAQHNGSIFLEPREKTFCNTTIHHNIMIIPDATQDDRFKNNEKVVCGDISFYAGVPIIVENQPVGAICIVDPEPREFSESEAGSLRKLARLVSKFISHSNIS